jgi:hypothetical protein
MIGVPYNIAITTEKARREPLLKPIFDEHEYLFGTDSSDIAGANLVLALFLMFEY